MSKFKFIIIFFVKVSLTADKSEVVPGNFPILCISGAMTCQTVAGVLTTIPHPFFDKLLPQGTQSKQFLIFKIIFSSFKCCKN